MHLISPEILDVARSHFSFGVLGAGLLVGVLLWLFGWWGHRFWIVLTATVGGGILGLHVGPEYHLHPVVAGPLLAVSAGVLALSLVRVFVFAAGGLAAWMIIHALAPLWDQLLLCFLVGGLIGLLLFRFWTMALTSFVGTLVAGHAGLVLIATLTEFDAIEWAGRNPIGLSVAVGLVSLLGLATQGAQVRRTHVREEKEQKRRERKKRRDPIDNGHLPPDLERLKEAFERPP